jgi:hypothetical protein
MRLDPSGATSSEIKTNSSMFSGSFLPSWLTKRQEAETIEKRKAKKTNISEEQEGSMPIKPRAQGGSLAAAEGSEAAPTEISDAGIFEGLDVEDEGIVGSEAAQRRQVRRVSNRPGADKFTEVRARRGRCSS